MVFMSQKKSVAPIHISLHMSTPMRTEITEELNNVLSEIFQDHTSNSTTSHSTEDDYSGFLSIVTRHFVHKVLHFQGFHFKMTVVTRLPKLLRLKPELRKINLFDNMIQDSGVQSLYQVLLASPQITSLNIGCNDLSEGCLICLCDLIRESRINRLQLGCHDVSWQLNRFSPEALSQLLRTITAVDRLECLGFSRLLGTKMRKTNRAMHTFVSCVGELLERCETLSTLDISYLEFTQADQVILSTGFSRNKRLRHLDISGNSFSTGTRLTDGITQMKTLRYLDISKCNLQSPACLGIASALKKSLEIEKRLGIDFT
jgi:Leucine-rich repeat (LRR) protein